MSWTSDICMTNDNNTLHGDEGAGAVIALQTAPVAKPDPLLEELQVVRLEDRYFCFDKHEPKQRKKGLPFPALSSQLPAFHSGTW